MMRKSIEPFLPDSMSWQDLFHIIIVSAGKPSFFNKAVMPMYQVQTKGKEVGWMKEVFKMEEGKVYAGGMARGIEKLFGCQGRDILYVGDHMFTDVTASNKLEWRTALIVQELESEVEGLIINRQRLKDIGALLRHKDSCSSLMNILMMHIQYLKRRSAATTIKLYARPQLDTESHLTSLSQQQAEAMMSRVIKQMRDLDIQLEPLITEDGNHVNQRWGYMSRAGFTHKSQFMWQIEKYADIYTSRVSNLYPYTPYMYFRSPQQHPPHDKSPMDKQ